MSGSTLMDNVMSKIRKAIEKELAKAGNQLPYGCTETPTSATGLAEGETGATPEPTAGTGEAAGGGGAPTAVKADPLAALMEEIRDMIAEGLADYRAERTIYESALGNFIIEQIPYTTWENLDLPNLPLERDGENRWVRKSGVLAKNTALNPLPKDEPIPAGEQIDFTYADWDYLREQEGAAAFDKPEGDQKRPAGAIPPDRATTYQLNIIKSIRLRYTHKDRRYRPNQVSAATPRDLQTGYILISYSGGNSGY